MIRKILEAIEKVRVSTRTREEEVWTCPHCKQEIHEKGLFLESNGVYHHRACGGELELPAPDDAKLEAFRLAFPDMYETIAKKFGLDEVELKPTPDVLPPGRDSNEAYQLVSNILFKEGWTMDDEGIDVHDFCYERWRKEGVEAIIDINWHCPDEGEEESGLHVRWLMANETPTAWRFTDPTVDQMNEMLDAMES